MIKNYLTLALKVLRRRPFYTFISLFGVSFTLMILMLITSMGDALFGANQPMTEVDRMVFIPGLSRYTQFYDTIYAVDSVMMDDGTMRYDSTMEMEESGSNNSDGSMSYYFTDEFLRNFSDVESYTFFAPYGNIDGFLEGRKISFRSYYTDHNYWEVFDFDFLYGFPYGEDDVKEQNKAVVLTDKSALEYFGEISSQVIGKSINLGEEIFVVKGIVERPLKDDPSIHGDIYLPVTTIDNRKLDSRTLDGPFAAVFLATSAGKRESVINQINFFAENFTMPPEEDYQEIRLYPGTSTEVMASGLLQTRDYDQAVLILFIPLLILLVLFLALPLINLINLNISRVYERKSEIAVRKAFGADSRNILYQFIFENLVLTFIGGAIGLLLALFVIRWVNANDLIGIVRLAFSVKVFSYFIIVIVLFGLLSGIVPAYRMSRTHISNALR